MRLPFHLVVDYAHEKEEIMQRAFLEFFGADVSNVGAEDHAFPLFSEWLIFDFLQDSGISFIVEYILKNPDKLDDITLSRLTQAAETNKYGAFEIIDIKRSKWIDLEHLFSGNKFKVYDVSSSETIPERGNIHARIGKIEGEWYFVGSNPFYFGNTFTERMKKILRKDNNSADFVSPKETWNIINAPKKTPPTLTQKEMEQKKITIERKYNVLVKKNNIKLSFNDVIYEIYEENHASPLDIWQLFIKKGIPKKVLLDNTELFQNVWNFFPHKILQNNSPAQMLNKLKKAK